MGGATTRSRKAKATEADEHIGTCDNTTTSDELNTRVKQLATDLDKADQRREATEAELRQAVTELKFEQSRLRERQARLQSVIRRQHEAMHQLELKHVQATATMTALERILFAHPSASQLPAAMTSEPPRERLETMRQDKLHLPAAPASMDKERSGFAAADRASDIDELHSEVSSHESVSMLSAALASYRYITS